LTPSNSEPSQGRYPGPTGKGKNSHKKQSVFAFAPTKPTIFKASQLLGISHRNAHEQTSWIAGHFLNQLCRCRLAALTGKANSNVLRMGRR
jgi:hypothetical protein